MNFIEKLNGLIAGNENALVNPKRRDLIKAAVKNKEVLVSANGALATWTRIESTGRSPKDTLTVRRPEIEARDRLGLAEQPAPGSRHLRHDPGRRAGAGRQKGQAVRDRPRRRRRQPLRPAGAHRQRPCQDRPVRRHHVPPRAPGHRPQHLPRPALHPARPAGRQARQAALRRAAAQASRRQHLGHGGGHGLRRAHRRRDRLGLHGQREKADVHRDELPAAQGGHPAAARLGQRGPGRATSPCSWACPAPARPRCPPIPTAPCWATTSTAGTSTASPTSSSAATPSSST